MLNANQANISNHYRSETPASHTFTPWTIGAAVSGLDLVTEMALRLYQAKADTASHYPVQSDALPESHLLRAQNQLALALLEEWYAEPDDLGAEWWAEFEQELRQNRLTFRTF